MPRNDPGLEIKNSTVVNQINIPNVCSTGTLFTGSSERKSIVILVE